jgi:ABC-type ATPase with predicted acetyltransferase domain
LLNKQIVFKDLNAHYKAKKFESDRCNKVRNAFGIINGNTSSNILPNFSLTIDPCDVVLITGASGSGKSTILRLLTSKFVKVSTEMEHTGILPDIDDSNIAVLDSNSYLPLPLIEQIKQGEPLEEAIKLLNSVGLSEAHLYLKDTSQISDGQKYRFAIAKLCDSKKPIWVADEFVSSLNPEMAAIVSRGLRKIAYLYGSTLFLAAPHISNFSGSLIPNKLVIVQWGREARIFSLKTQLSQDGKKISLELTNNGQMLLSNIQIGFTDLRGKFTIKQKIELLNPTENIQTEFSLKYTHDVYTINIKTDEGIGDIFYLK